MDKSLVYCFLDHGVRVGSNRQKITPIRSQRNNDAIYRKFRYSVRRYDIETIYRRCDISTRPYEYLAAVSCEQRRPLAMASRRHCCDWLKYSRQYVVCLLLSPTHQYR